MILVNSLRVMQFQKNILMPMLNAVQVRGYAVPSLGKAVKAKKGQVVQKKKLPVEEDVNKLLTYCCGSNIFVEGEDARLKPDSEYPDWLWNLNIQKPIPLEELDPNSKTYWRRMRKIGMRRNDKLSVPKRNY